MLEGRYRTCVEWQEVYSPALGKYVRRCKRYQAHYPTGPVSGLEGRYWHCVEWQEVYSPALGKYVRRCKRYAPGGTAGVELGETYVPLRERARMGELGKVIPPGTCTATRFGVYYCYIPGRGVRFVGKSPLPGYRVV